MIDATLQAWTKIDTGLGINKKLTKLNMRHKAKSIHPLAPLFREDAWQVFVKHLISL